MPNVRYRSSVIVTNFLRNCCFCRDGRELNVEDGEGKVEVYVRLILN